MDEEPHLSLGENIAVTEADLRDHKFWALIADFLGCQTGEELNLKDTPCKNRLLIQVGLMREDKQLSWEAVVQWLQKIFPDFQSANFRCLIERGIATTLSLGRDSRQTFLNSNVNFEFVGPICDSIGVDRTDLLEMKDFSEQAKSIEVTNGLILELNDFVSRENIDPIVLVTWLRNFHPQFCSDSKTQKASKVLQAKVKKLMLIYQNYLKRKHKRNAVMENLLQSPFELVPNQFVSEIRKFGTSKRMKTSLMSKGKNERSIKEESESYAISGEDVKPYVKLASPPKYQLVKVKEENLHSRDESYQEMHNSSNNVDSVPVDENPDADKGEALTLLDIAMLSVQKLASVYGGKTDASKQVSMDLLKNQYALTCKEHPAMKLFEERITLLNGCHSLASPLFFLHCNAHFLVEIHDVIEQQIMSIEREIMQSTGDKLGRDRNPKFKRFVNFAESATSRYIHMACDVLSPRAPAKQNYRRHWVAFCEEKKNPSKLAVNLSNRFNNYFEAAAGLTHHHKEIGLFFSDLLLMDNDDSPNIILESVTADATDEVIQGLVCVLAIIYCKLLGPYWQLLKSGGEYALFSQYILCFYQKLLEWSKDVSPLLEPEEIVNVFLQFPLQEKTFDGVIRYCGLGSGNSQNDLIRVCLQKMVKVIAAVTEDNLKDFLPGGIYSKIPSTAVCLKMTTCTFSTLMAEYPFGHAYPYKNKRPDRSSSLSSSSSHDEDHSNSSEVSDGENSTVQRAQLHPKSGKTPGLSRVKKRKLNKMINSTWKDDHSAMETDPICDATNRKSLIATVNKNGGPCTTQQDLDRLMSRLDGRSRAEKKEAIRCEISYQKLILGCTEFNLDSTDSTYTEMVSQLRLVLPRVKPGYCLISYTKKANLSKKQQRMAEAVKTTEPVLSSS